VRRDGGRLVNVLRRKLLRDIRNQLGQFAAIVALIALGSGLFVASYDAYRNLDRSYRQLFSQLRFADATIAGGDARRIADAVDAVDGVTAVRPRTVADVPLRIGDHKLIGRIVGLPVTGPASVNRVALLEGRRPSSATGDVLLEQHVAHHLGVHPGDHVRIRGPGGWRDVEVVGVAASTEYLWPARSRQDLFPAPDSFGVVFAPQPLAEAVVGGPNEVVVRVEEAQRVTALAGVRATALRTGARSVTTRAEQPSNAVLQEDIEGFQGLAVGFPLLFLSGAGMAAAVLLRRRVAAERTVVGTLRAVGVSRRQVRRHYLTYGLAAGAGGALLGVPLGLVAARELTAAYTGALDLPATVNAVYPESIVVGLVFGVVTGVLAAWLPARAAARLAPAAAMRGIVPHAGRAGALTRRLPTFRRWPATWRLVVRNPVRHPARTLSTMLGVVLALVLVLASAGMIDTIRALVDRQFSQIDRSDAQVVLADEASDRSVAALADVPGVVAAEPVAALPVTLVAGDARYDTSLQAFEAGTSMHRFEASDGTAVPLPTDGVLAGVALREQLGVTQGDRIRVLGTDGDDLGTVVISGFVDEPLGSPAYLDLTAFRRLAPGQPVATVALRFAPDAATAAVAERVSARDDVLAVSRTGVLQETVEDFLGLFAVFVGGMLLCGGLLAFGILFTTMSVNLAERATEVAALRASGVPQRRLARLITAENVLVTLLGLVPGLALGWLAATEALAVYDSDMFRLHLAMAPTTLVLAAVGMVAAALASQVPGLRALRRLDIAEIVRERAA
jgi:putative ABC transport system permease protein